MIQVNVKTTTGNERVTVLSTAETPRYRTKLVQSRKFDRESGTKPMYARNYIFLDTETSHLGDKFGWIYHWCIGYATEEYFTSGRTVDDLVNHLYNISINSGSIVVCYVHNLSYDFVYLSRQLEKKFGSLDKLFYTAPHKLLSAKVGNIEFRCSYRLSNNSLDGWCKTLNSRYIKDTGAIDYRIVRYPDSFLTDKDWEYMVSDVSSMKDCIMLTMKGWNITTIPLTSTGFVRQYCRTESKKDYWRKTFLSKYRMTETEYNKLRSCFMGGYVHGNRYHTSETINGMYCYDFTSSYPARCLYNDFPIEHFHFFGDMKGKTTKEKLERIFELSKTKCVLMRCKFYDLHIKTEQPFPYISKSKCIEKDSLQVDNGKVISADYISIDLTDIDFKIIINQYSIAGIEIDDIWVARKGKLPDFIRRSIQEFFYRKCQLPNTDPEYQKSKSRLNSLYGMMVQKINFGEYSENQHTGEIENTFSSSLEEAIEKYYKNRNSFLYYGHGVYVTAHARNSLYELMELIRQRLPIYYPDMEYMDSLLYCDTDSIFSSVDLQPIIAEYNEHYIALAKENGGICTDINGKTKILGFAELDKTADKFRYIHSKCYAYEKDGLLKVTIAGVTKRDRNNPKRTNGDELGNIDNLKHGFVFRGCGGTRCKYTYDDKVVNLNGRNITIGNSAIILDTEYRVQEQGAIFDAELDLVLPTETNGDVFGDLFN